MKDFIDKLFERWLSKRVPSNFTHTLSNRNIFIMPTKFGFAYLLFIVLLFMLGTNYQNNIILLFSYLLASLFITVMMHSFYNFSQIIFSSPAKQCAFVNQLANFPISINVKKNHYDLHIQFIRQHDRLKEKSNDSLPTLWPQKVYIEQCNVGESQTLIPYFAIKRGVYNLGRVKVFSEYPLGLFITWAKLDFSHQLVVFPQPKKTRNSVNYLSGLDNGTGNNSAYKNSGMDDFAELKNYIVGESKARVAWKQLARGQGKLSKHYDNQQGSLLWLKLSDMPSSKLETKLSYLCFLIVECSTRDREFGLLLDVSEINNSSSIKIEPSSGFQHQQTCLTALAEFKQNEVC